MKVLVTGGAGFIGRWVVKGLLEIDSFKSEGDFKPPEDIEVWVLDNLSNGSEENLRELEHGSAFKEFVKGDVRDKKLVEKLFYNRFDLCIQLAAHTTNVTGTYTILEEARKYNTKVVLVGTCMVYDLANSSAAIDEHHRLKPVSPYAGSKLAAEHMAESYYHGYGVPVVICRPFNTYGPFQKSDMEGGVVSIFIKRNLEGEELEIFGDGTQTRDLLYVEDCVDFLLRASFAEKAVGEVINAGTGKDLSINELALLVCEDKKRLKYLPHHHPQSEIAKLCCDYSKAQSLLGWKPRVSLKEGIFKTEEWMKSR
ncbi:MAG: GDP-mannose 4,6-dehydratase [Deltaproteobacteria bacterium]|nr:GDP-mannose 4,6-dehydratase [Deltaproteobacteria bacterium]